MLLGNVLDIGTPSDATVTNAKLGTDVISGETDIGGAIADADLVLVDDGAGGTLRKSAMSRVKTYVGTNTPYFYAYSTSGQTISHATETKKTFTTKIESDSGVFDLTNDKFTVVTAGKYFLTFNVYGYDSDNDMTRLDIWVKVNGTQIQKFTMNFYTDQDARDLSVGNSFIADLDTDDYVEMFVYQSTSDSGTISLEGSATVPSGYFSGFKLTE
jgi:hypothetical protein